MIKNIEKSIAFHQSGGIEVGDNVVIDGPITREQNLHIITHAHTDHARESQISESLGNSGAEVIMTEATRELMGYTNLNLRTSHRYKSLEYNAPRVFENAGSVEVEFLDANHMLGSTQVKVVDPNLEYSIGYSGDIGRNIEKPIDVDVLVLDATYASFEDKRRYTKEDAFDALAQKMLEFINKGYGINIVAHSGLLQSTLHNLGIRKNIFGFEIWDKFPEVLAGGQSKSHASKIKHFCNVYKEFMYKQPNVLNLKDDKDDTWSLEVDNSRIALFSSIEDIQNNHLPTFVCEYNPSGYDDPLTKSQRLNEGYHVALSEHDTGNSIDKYIKNVNPELVITDSIRANPDTRADDLAILIKNKLDIEAISSKKLMSDVLFL